MTEIKTDFENYMYKGNKFQVCYFNPERILKVKRVKTGQSIEGPFSRKKLSELAPGLYRFYFDNHDRTTACLFFITDLWFEEINEWNMHDEEGFEEQSYFGQLSWICEKFLNEAVNLKGRVEFSMLGSPEGSHWLGSRFFHDGSTFGFISNLDYYTGDERYQVLFNPYIEGQDQAVTEEYLLLKDEVRMPYPSKYTGSF